MAQKDTSAINQLDPVIVTANKIAQKQSTTGKVITVISKEQIEKSAGKSVAQILNEQAGVVINGALNNLGSVQTVYMRGASSGRALIMIDGIPVNDPSMINNEYDLNLFSINDVERIEICKGAQSTLYGSDAIAGVINIITIKSNVTTPFNYKATISGSSYETFKGNLQLYGKSDKLLYTVRYARLYAGGFSAAYDSSGKKNFDKDGYDGNYVNASVAYQLNNNLLVKTFAQYNQYKSGLDAGAFTDKTNDNLNNRNFITGTGLQYHKNNIHVTANYQYTTTNRNYNDNASVPGAASWSTNNYNAVGQYAELFTNIKLSNNFSLLAGTDYRYSSMNSQYNSFSIYGPYNSASRDTFTSQTSLYASGMYFFKKLNIELGTRMNHHSRYGTNFTYTFNPSYQINNQFRIFGSIASGFKAPSIYQLYDTYSGNTNLKAETSINYETGIQFQQRNLSARAVYFYRIIDNGIDYNYINYQYFNYVKQNVNGLEFEVNYKPSSNININFNYTYLSPKETTQNRATNKDTVTYNYLLKRPNNNFNVSLGWQATTQLYLSISRKYAGKRYDAGGYKKADVALSDYFIMGASATYELDKHVKFFFDVQNIFNTQFFDVYGYNSIPTLVNIGLTLH